MAYRLQTPLLQLLLLLLVVPHQCGMQYTLLGWHGI
jgi:hypothetical protein